MVARRLTEATAMAMIGDGVLGVLAPAAHCRLWEAGPRWWRAMVEPFSEHPAMTRCVAAAELGLGVWLGLRAEHTPAQA
jgi:hypothetical protein